MSDRPVVYILHGDDEFAIHETITSLEAKVGDAATADMNTTRLDGSSFSVDSMVTATHAMPFLADRRLVILTDPLGGMKSPQVRDRFKAALESIPSSTALVIQISRPLVSERDKRKGVRHWLQTWGAGQGDRVLIRELILKHGDQMALWIQKKAAELGGEFTLQAAHLLAGYVMDDPRLAAQEVGKILAYANYDRPVEVDDVELLTPFAGEGDVFKMVDALGNRNSQLALRMLHRLLEVDEPLRLFGMIVRQFRMLLLTREMVDSGFGEAVIAKKLKTYPFIARKLVSQVRNFSTEVLDDIYHQLLGVDEAIKTGKMDGDAALDVLITTLTH